MNLRNGLIAAAFAAIAVVAAIGWTRHSNPQAATNAPAVNGGLVPGSGVPGSANYPADYGASPNYAPANARASYNNNQPAYGQGYEQPGYAQPSYAQSGYVNSGYAAPPYPPAYYAPAETYATLIPQPVVVRQPAPEPVYAQAPPPPSETIERQEYVTRPEYEYRRGHYRRSTGKSVAIVAGSAGAGAAIGALAGGGKGAGIGALAGGAGGFIYDRLTHNH